MILTTFDQELHDKTEREAAYTEGKRDGRAEGEAKVVALNRKKAAKGMEACHVAEDLGFDAETEKFLSRHKNWL